MSNLKKAQIFFAFAEGIFLRKAANRDLTGFFSFGMVFAI
jgi:hypothetical protein